ncbi:MAG: DUF4347 domain-containing protein [Rhizomicrobium sp.]
MTIQFSDDLVSAQDESGGSSGPLPFGNELLFVDSTIANLQDVLNNVRAGVQVVVLNSTEDALDQIAAVLSGRDGVSAIHIVADGERGQIDFAAGALDLAGLDSHADDLKVIKNSLAPGGDLLLWSCNTGAGEAGFNFVSALSRATGADVAASSNLTGAAFLGGDFNLEVQTGHIDAAVPLTPGGLQAFDEVLAATTLAAGDIAFVGYNTDTTDGFSFVALRDIGSGTVIRFTDQAWTGSAFTASGTDGTVTFTAAADIAAGTVIASTSGQFTGGTLNLEDTGETLYAYQGAVGTPTKFLFAADFADGNTTFNGSLSGTGLTNGTNAVAVALDNAYYGGQTTGVSTTQLASIANLNSWISKDTAPLTPYGGPLLPPDGQVWVVTAGGGASNTIVHVDKETGSLVGANQAALFASNATFNHPTDFTFDTLDGLYFFADSNLGNNRIIEGHISDLVTPGATPTFTTVYSDTSANNLITAIGVDTANDQIYFTYDTAGGFDPGGAVKRVNYNGTGLVSYGTYTPPSHATNGGFSGGFSDMTLDLAHSAIYLTNLDAFGDLSGNFTADANYLVKLALSGTPSAPGATGTFSTLTLSGETAEPTYGANFFPSLKGALYGIDIDPVAQKLYFTTQMTTVDANHHAGVYSYDLAAHTVTTLYTQGQITAIGTTPSTPMYYIEVDPTSGKYYLMDGNNSANGGANNDASIYIGDMSGGTPSRFFTVREATSASGPQGLIFELQPNLTFTNAAPTYTETAGTPSAAGPGLAILTSASASDPDNTGLAGATVAITTGFFGGDSLLFTNSGGITGSYNASTGVLTFTGVASFAAYQTVLQSVQFTNAGDNPTNYDTDTSRTITTVVSDGLIASDPRSSTVTVVGVNDAPVLANGSTITYVEQAAAATIDSGITLADPDNLNQSSATVTISANFQTGDTLAANVAGTSITASYDSGTHVLTLSGSDTLANYQQVLRTVTFVNSTNDDPTAGGATTRTITFVANDGGLNSNSLTATINVTPVNDAPTLTATGLNPTFTEAAGLGTQTGAASVFSGAASGTIESGQGIAGLTFTVSGLADGANEKISVDGTAITLGANSSGTTSTNTMGYAVTISSGTATIVLTKGGGGITTAQANALVNGITYQDTSTDDPTAGNRVFTLTQVKDSGGTANSGVDTTTLSIASTVTVVKVNDAPALSATAANPTFTEAGGLGTQAAAVAAFSGAAAGTIESGQGIAGLTFTVSGLVDGANEKISVDGTAITLGADSSGTTTTNTMGYAVTISSGTATIVLTKGGGGITTSAANTLVNGITYQNTNTDDPTAGNRVFTLTQVKDNGGTANSGADTTTLSIASTVAVAPVNDAPTLTATGLSPTFTEAAGLGTQTGAASVFSGAASGTIESGQGIAGLTFTVSGLADGANEKISVDGTAITLGADSSGTTTTNAMGYAVTISSGTATIVLTKGAGGITTAQANALVNGITYQDTSTDDPTAGNRVFTLTQIKDSGGTANGGVDATTLSIASTVNVVKVNDAPTLSATATDPTFTEAAGAGTQAAAVAVFSSAAAGTIESGQGIAGLTFTVSGLADGANEKISVDGTAITLGGNSSGTTTTNTMGYAVTISGGTATVVLTKGGGGITTAAANTLVDNITYQDTSTDNPTGGDRIFTLTQVKDSGGTANSGADTTTLSIASTVHVTPVNDAAVVAGTVTGSVTEKSGVANGTAGVATASATLTDTDPDGAANSFQAVSAGAATTNGYGTYAMTAGGTWTYTLDDTKAAVEALNVGGSLNDTFTVLTADGTAQLITITIHGADDAAVAKDDAFTTTVTAAIGPGLNLFDDNGAGADADVDGPALSVGAVAGGTVGTPFTLLPSGATLTVNSDGTFSYDPTNATLILSKHLAAPGTSASNTSYIDTFSYTLTDGGTATATVTVNGVNNANTIYEGDGGNNTITGDATLGGLYHLEQGGDDTVTGGSGNDGFYFGNAFTAADTVNGGGGTNDQIGLEGASYAAGLTLGPTTISGVEVIACAPGFSYSLTTVDANVATGDTLTIWAVRLASTNTLTFDGSAEADGGKFVVYGGAGNDVLTGGNGDDRFFGLGGADTLTGNDGADTFVYISATNSTGNANGTTYDTIVGFDAAVDRFDLPGSVTGVDTAQSGDLSSASFDSDLGAVLGSGQAGELGANHAVLYTATGGTLNAHLFLVVDADGIAGYQSGADFVFDITGATNLGSLGGAFV